MGEINVYGNVHTFGETPPLTVYGPVLNVEQTRRNVWSSLFPHRCLHSDNFFQIVLAGTLHSTSYNRLQKVFVWISMTSNTPRF